MSEPREAHSVTAFVCDCGNVHIEMLDDQNQTFGFVVLRPEAFLNIGEGVNAQLREWTKANRPKRAKKKLRKAPDGGLLQ